MNLQLKLLCLILLVSVSTKAQVLELGEFDNDRKEAIVKTYKVINGDTLNLTFRYPDKFKLSKKYPAIIFFFGGGWSGGTTEQFKPHVEYFASRGMVTVLADYRVKSRHQTTPFEAVFDVKTAMRFLRKHAEKLNINTDKIVASGGSAGGHLAAALGTLSGFDEPGEDLSISATANALVLFNPVFDNGPEGFQNERMGERWEEISPAHNIKKGVPPTIVFLGTKDHLVPVQIAEKYKAKMEAVGGRCDLFLYEGEGHGFFNSDSFKHKGDKYYNETVRETDLFLKSLKYLKGNPGL